MHELSQAAQHLIETNQFLSWGFLPWLGIVLFPIGIGGLIFFWRWPKSDTKTIVMIYAGCAMLFGGVLLSDVVGTPRWLPLIGDAAGINKRQEALVAIDDAQRRQAEILEPQMQAFANALSSYLTSETMGDVMQQALPERFISIPSCTILRAGYLFSERQEGTGEAQINGSLKHIRSIDLQYSGQSTPDFNGEESAYLLIETGDGPLRVIVPGRSIATSIRTKLQNIADNIGDHPTHVGAVVARMLPEMLLPAHNLEQRNYAQIDAVVAAFDSGHRVAAIDGYVLHSQNDGTMTPTVIVAERIAFVVDAAEKDRLPEHAAITTTKTFRFPAIVTLEAVRGFLDKTIQRKWFMLSVPSDRDELAAMRKQYGL